MGNVPWFHVLSLTYFLSFFLSWMISYAISVVIVRSLATHTTVLQYISIEIHKCDVWDVDGSMIWYVRSILQFTTSRIQTRDDFSCKVVESIVLHKLNWSCDFQTHSRCLSASSNWRKHFLLHRKWRKQLSIKWMVKMVCDFIDISSISIRCNIIFVVALIELMLSLSLSLSSLLTISVYAHTSSVLSSHLSAIKIGLF